MTTIALPHPKDVRDLLEGLLGREVEVGAGEPVLPTETALAGVGLYVEDNLSLAAAIAADLELTAYAGAALGLIPAGSAQDMIRSRQVSDAVWENFGELLNIGVSLLRHDSTPHVRLYSANEPGDLPQADVCELLRGLGRRIDLSVTISGYGTGNLSIVRKF
jgi:hypothetical protein